ncbi:golgin subfamily A member 6-like protein 26 [Anabrus simplex]|uniref:golgin subfamily A member 6-like protein 26 n=1 Tax=Anabrus simplex TaxID=316456 RepID=UPI0035A3D2F4
MKFFLSEGQRKAHYEECDAEKKKNTERMHQLKKEIKDLQSKVGKPDKSAEAVLRASNKSLKEINILINKRSDEVAVILGDKIVDKKKKLDLLRHQSRKLQEKMKRFADEYQELQVKITAAQGKKNAEALANQRICSLENQIHRVEMNMMEAEHVKKKYRSIRSDLLDDSVEFESSLEKIEQMIQNQEKEIIHLEEINKEALDLRDMTKGTLMKQEVMALNAGKARDRQLIEFRARVEERKQELERLERLIFPSARGIIHQDSASSSEITASQAEETATAKATEFLESAFAKLKEATGESETDEVLQRFLSQKETMSRLTYLKNITEKEKRELEMRKDFMMAELESFKFAEVKDKEENMEEVEKIRHQIEEFIRQKEQYEEQKRKIIEQLIDIVRILCIICKKLENVARTFPEVDISRQFVEQYKGQESVSWTLWVTGREEGNQNEASYPAEKRPPTTVKKTPPRTRRKKTTPAHQEKAAQPQPRTAVYRGAKQERTSAGSGSQDMDSSPVPAQPEDPESGDELLRVLTQKIESTLLYINRYEEEEEVLQKAKQSQQPWMAVPPTYRDFTKALNQLKPRKAPGPDNIPLELIQNGGIPLKTRLFTFILLIWENREEPDDLKNATIITIFKKGGRSVCGNYCGISLLSTVGKILARVLLNQLQVISERILPESQCGFRTSRGTTDLIFCSRQLQEKCGEQQQPLYLVFYDLERAFDSVQRSAIWKVLSHFGCPERYVELVQTLHDGMSGQMEAQAAPTKAVSDDAWMFLSQVKGGADKGPQLGGSETDDEDDVPTRGYLKRQAQIIVDAKSRRKQFNFNRGRK